MFGHTRWRGIRLGLSGSAKDHALKGLRYPFLTAITLGIYTPFMRNHLSANCSTHTWIGDGRLHYPRGQGNAGGGLAGFVVVFLAGQNFSLSAISLSAVSLAAVSYQPGGLGS